VRDDEAIADTRKFGRQTLGYPVCEIILGRIA
jgi:hypothetical protein